MRQVGYLQGSYQDAQSTKHKTHKNHKLHSKEVPHQWCYAKEYTEMWENFRHSVLGKKTWKRYILTEEKLDSIGCWMETRENLFIYWLHKVVCQNRHHTGQRIFLKVRPYTVEAMEIRKQGTSAADGFRNQWPLDFLIQNTCFFSWTRRVSH